MNQVGLEEEADLPEAVDGCGILCFYADYRFRHGRRNRRPGICHHYGWCFGAGLYHREWLADAAHTGETVVEVIPELEENE